MASAREFLERSVLSIPIKRILVTSLERTGSPLLIQFLILLFKLFKAEGWMISPVGPAGSSEAAGSSGSASFGSSIIVPLPMFVP